MLDTVEHVMLLKEELARNEETISSLRARNIDIVIRLIAHVHGVSVGDVVKVPNGTCYRVCCIGTDRWLYRERMGGIHAKPWITGNPHTKDGVGWDTKQEINLYANWEKVA